MTPDTITISEADAVEILGALDLAAKVFALTGDAIGAQHFQKLHYTVHGLLAGRVDGDGFLIGDPQKERPS